MTNATTTRTKIESAIIRSAESGRWELVFLDSALEEIELIVAASKWSRSPGDDLHNESVDAYGNIQGFAWNVHGVVNYR